MLNSSKDFLFTILILFLQMLLAPLMAEEYLPSDFDNFNPFLLRGKRNPNPKNKQKIISASEDAFTELPCNLQLAAATWETASGETRVKWLKDGKIFRVAVMDNSSMADKKILAATAAAASGNKTTSAYLKDESRVYINQKNASLIFLSTTSSDAGFYACQVADESSEAIQLSDFQLNIIENLRFFPQPASKKLELGSIGRVHCRAQGSPNPLVRWVKYNGDDLPETVEDRNGTLTFENVTNDHNGNYTCLAVNNDGEIAATITITVVVSPQFSKLSEGPINVIEMDEIMLHCQAIGDPKPTIQWDKNLVYLTNNDSDNRFKVLENGTLQIKKVHLDDEGRYGCTIGNSAGLKREEIEVYVNGTEIMNVSTPAETNSFITRTVVLSVSVSLFYIFCVIALMIWCRHRRSRRRETRDGSKPQQSDDALMGDEEENIGEKDECLIEKSEKSSRKHNSDSRSKNSDDSKSRATMSKNIVNIAKSDLVESHKWGRGVFGDVLIMKLNMASDAEKRKSSRLSLNDPDEIQSLDGASEKTVMMRTIQKGKEEEWGAEFKRQLDLFASISHENVVKLFGLCDDKELHGMVLEWTDWGDFKQFLIATGAKGNAEPSENAIKSKSQPLKIAQMLTAAYQILKGVEIIYRSKLIHKDIATRNCIISSNFCVKISYPALSKDKYRAEYYNLEDNLMPLRWLAPECIKNTNHTVHSEIYAYGVLVWEIFTHAANLPLESTSNEDFLTKLTNNQLERQLADNTPDSLKEILTKCWSILPKERPSVSQLSVQIHKTLESECSKN